MIFLGLLKFASKLDLGGSIVRKFSILILAALIAVSARVSLAQDSLTLMAELWGEEDGDYFVICASAGDVNGDGCMDIIVGAFQDRLHDPGYVKIFLGSEEFDTMPDLKMIGEGEDPFGDYSGFGWSVACAGDVNRDGYDDVIVGAPYAFNYDSWTWNAGKVYMYLGGNPMDTTVDAILQDSDYNYHYGHSVSSAGDVNADGYDDIVVGTDDFGWGSGRSFIYLGGENMDSQLDVYIEGTAQKAENLGISVAGVGDLDGDGYDDVLIGAPNTGGWPYPIGRASIYFGGDPMDSTTDVTFRGDSIDFLNFGRGVCRAGDVNGDTIPDFVVGGTRRQKVLFGSRPPDTASYMTLPAGIAGETQLSSGDINGDGFSDIMIRTNILYGGIDIDSIADIVVNNPDTSASPGFALAVAFAGDIDGNESKEFLLSSYGGSSHKGVVFVFTSNLTFVGEQEEKKQLNFHLHQNYPNPFNSGTTIPYTVNSTQKTAHSEGRVKLTVYNILGQKVKVLVDERKPPGYYEVTWDGRDDSGQEVGSGVYLCRLKARGFLEVRKIVLLK